MKGSREGRRPLGETMRDGRSEEGVPIRNVIHRFSVICVYLLKVINVSASIVSTDCSFQVQTNPWVKTLPLRFLINPSLLALYFYILKYTFKENKIHTHKRLVGLNSLIFRMPINFQSCWSNDGNKFWQFFNRKSHAIVLF